MHEVDVEHIEVLDNLFGHIDDLVEAFRHGDDVFAIERRHEVGKQRLEHAVANAVGLALDGMGTGQLLFKLARRFELVHDFLQKLRFLHAQSSLGFERIVVIELLFLLFLTDTGHDPSKV